MTHRMTTFWIFWIILCVAVAWILFEVLYTRSTERNYAEHNERMKQIYADHSEKMDQIYADHRARVDAFQD